MKNVLYKCSSFVVNLLEGAVSVLAISVINAFIFENNNSNHDIGLGIFVLLIWLLLLLTPNVLFKLCGKLHKKDVIIFQIVPFITGAVLYILFQLVLY